MADTYCVPGPHNGWNPASDPMTLGDDGYYFKIYESVTSLTFKVSDGSWANSWGYNDVNTSACEAGITISQDGTNVVLGLASAADIMIKFDAATHKIWVVFYVTSEPTAHLSLSEQLVLPGTEITLTASSEHFTGAVSYAYSCSTDNTNWNPIAADASATSVNFTVPANTLLVKYYFKVVASSATQSDEADAHVDIAQIATVAGSTSDYGDIVSPAFGTYWNMTDINNDMDYSAGVFTLTKSKIFLPAKNLMFKIGLNHDWGYSYPTNDYQLSIPQAGYYDLTFSLTWEGKVVSATATYLYPKVELMASWNNWEPVEMIANNEGTTCSSTVSVPAGKYEGDATGFKVRINEDNTWYGANDTIKRANAAALRTKILTDANHNCGLWADLDVADYTFTFQYSDSAMLVQFPISIIRHFENAGDYQTIAVPFTAEIRQVNGQTPATFYTIGTFNDDHVTLTQANYVGGGSYIIKSKIAGDIEIYQPGGASYTKIGEPVSGNTGLYGTIFESIVYDYDGTGFREGYANNSDWSVYVLMNDNKFHLVSTGSTATILPTRAYLHIKNVPAQSGAPAAIRIVEEGQDATNLQNLEANEQAVKFIENGQLFILRDGITYDALGRAIR